MALGNVTATLSYASRWQAGQEYTGYGYYTVGAAVAQNDTITFTNIVPAGGVQIISTRLQIPKLDTNATPTATLILGDATDDNRFINNVSGGWDDEASYVMYDSNVTPDVPSTVGVGYTYTAATSLILKINAAVATAASTGHIALWVKYYCSGF
jgi:hypothetical protein